MADINERELFPERGMKVSQGRVYQELAFGSTRPRGMMPAHLSVDMPDRAKRSIARRKKRLAKVEKCRQEVEKRRHDVYVVMNKHRKRREDYLNRQQLNKFHSAIKHMNSGDDGLRAPDKSGAFRDYSAIDKSLWTMGELREWFNKYGTSEPPKYDQFNPEYTVHARAATANPSRVRRASRAISTAPAPKEQGRTLGLSASLPQLSTSARMRPPPRAHWLDFEGSLAESRRFDEELRASGATKVEMRRPWKDRPAKDEGWVVSSDTLVNREKALFVDSKETMQRQQAMKDRTRAMLRGEAHGML